MYANMVCNGNPGVVGLSTLNAGVSIASQRLGMVYVGNIREVQHQVIACVVSEFPIIKRALNLPHR